TSMHVTWHGSPGMGYRPTSPAPPGPIMRAAFLDDRPLPARGGMSGRCADSARSVRFMRSATGTDAVSVNSTTTTSRRLPQQWWYVPVGVTERIMLLANTKLDAHPHPCSSRNGVILTSFGLSGTASTVAVKPERWTLCAVRKSSSLTGELMSHAPWEVFVRTPRKRVQLA